MDSPINVQIAINWSNKVRILRVFLAWLVTVFFRVRLQVTIMTTRCQALTSLVIPDVTRRDLKAVASELWAFFPLKLTPRIFFFLGVACLEYNFGESPGVAEKERLAQEFLSRQHFNFSEHTWVPSHTLRRTFEATRRWFVLAAASLLS